MRLHSRLGVRLLTRVGQYLSIGLLTVMPVAWAQTGAQNSEAAAISDSLFSEDGYRLRQYRTPTPQSPSFATTLTTSQLQMMLTVHPNPVLVDVIKIPWRQGRFVETEPHRNIPGSLWLPAAGLGELPEAWVEHFKDVLDQATGNNRRQAIVFYCKADCWLSWNAARRADKLGYERIYWFRDGVDGWRETGLELADAEPILPSGNMVDIQ
jgi:PQQ-dependent catabolism-associated CXXCW motif protein